MLLAEEVDRAFQVFLQPPIEQKHAYEHVVRAKAAELNIGKHADDAYIEDCLKKALGHEYRAFFDAADWLGIRFREIVIELLNPYTVECITAVLPEYYKEMRPKIEMLDKEISEVRDEKDVSQDDKILPEIGRYRAVIDQLVAMHGAIAQKIPSLVEYTKKEEKARIKKQVWEVLLIIFGAAVGAFITWLCVR